MQKNWLSYDEQLDLLTRRGMWIEDESGSSELSVGDRVLVGGCG